MSRVLLGFNFLCSFYLSLFLSWSSFCKADDASSLKQVQILFRHGDRTPTQSYPNDPWKNAWPEGYGQLTTLGMEQQYRLGQYLKERYGKLIHDGYNRSSVYVRSTDVDRTLMSAYSNLAGFFPPEGSQIWDKNLLWQPIPVHTKPVSEDYLLSSDAVCPKYDELYRTEMNSPAAQEINNKYESFYSMLSNKTGWEIKDFDKASQVWDILYIENIHNFTLPEWVNESVLANMEQFEIISLQWLDKTHEMRKLRGGVLVGEMVKNMQLMIDGKETSKAHIYSAHDVTVVALLSALDVFEPHAPHYCSTVMVELLLENETYSVKIMYRNETDHDPLELKLKGCSSPCPFDKFKLITRDIIPTDIKKECSTQLNDNVALISAIAGSVLGCALLMLIISAYAFYRRNSDSYRYLNIQNEI